MTRPMFESENTYDLGLLQNARARDPERTVKLLKKNEKNILHRTQVH